MTTYAPCVVMQLTSSWPSAASSSRAARIAASPVCCRIALPAVTSITLDAVTAARSSPALPGMPFGSCFTAAPGWIAVSAKFARLAALSATTS